MAQRGGVAIDPKARGARRDLDAEQTGTRGLDRGVLTTMALEDLVIGVDMFLSVVDIGHLPFALAGIAVQASDAAAGALNVALYRVDADDVLPTRFTARRSGVVQVVAKATPKEYMVVLAQEKEIDRIAAAWIVGVFGATATMTVRGCQSYTTPSFSAWKLAAPGVAPATIDSRALTYDLRVPSVALLTQAGTRLRGTGTIP